MWWKFKSYKSVAAFAVAAVMLMIAVSLGSCQKRNNMGPLRGQWQIMSIERPGQEPEVPDAPRRYICFDLKIIQLTTSLNDIAADNPYYIGEVSGEDPNYTFTFPYDQADPATWLPELQKWGIDGNPANAEVLELNSSTLRMKVGSNTLTLRRF